MRWEPSTGQVRVSRQSTNELDKIRKASRVYFEGEGEDLLDCDAVCDRLEGIGQELRRLRRRISTVRQENQSQSGFPMEFSSPIKTATTISSHTSISRSPFASHSTASVTTATRDESDDEDKRTEVEECNDGTEEEIEDEVQYALLVAGLQDAKIKLSIAKTRNQEAKIQLTELKLALVRNEVFGLQSNEMLLSRWALELDEARPAPILAHIPHFRLVEVATLANDFPGTSFKPIQPKPTRWLQVLCLDIDIGNDSVTWSQCVNGLIKLIN
jgi:hypothetical protein